MIYADGAGAGTRVQTVAVAAADRERYCLSDADVVTLARQALIIEEHYGRPMDIEWGRDGSTGQIYILQARPETVQSRTGRGPAALQPAGAIAGDRDRSRHRLAHRQPDRARVVALGQRHAAGAAWRRAGGGHDRSGLGTGDEARGGHRHQSRRPHLPRRHHRARTGDSRRGRLWRCHAENHRRQAGDRVLCRRGHRKCLRGPARVRAAGDQARRHAGRAGQDHDERRPIPTAPSTSPLFPIAASDWRAWNSSSTARSASIRARCSSSRHWSRRCRPPFASTSARLPIRWSSLSTASPRASRPSPAHSRPSR